STAVFCRGPAPLQASEDVPASGARPRRRVVRYAVAVLNPGMGTDNRLESEDYGFPPAEPRRERPRLRLGVSIAVTALGFVLAAATALMFVMIVDFGVEDLTEVLGGAAGHLPGTTGAAEVGTSSPVPG